MKSAIVSLLAIALLGSAGCSAGSHDFDSVVAGVEQRYNVRAQRIPLMGIISLCARAKTHGGVKGMNVAEFDHIGNLDTDGLYSMMQSHLGSGWEPMVRDRSRTDTSIIFVQPSADERDSLEMMIADYEHGKLDLVRMDMNGSALAKWIQHPVAGSGTSRGDTF